jgi:hypothetical protein
MIKNQEIGEDFPVVPSTRFTVKIRYKAIGDKAQCHKGNSIRAAQKS